MNGTSFPNALQQAFTETSAHNQSLYVNICCRNETNIYFHRACGTNWCYFFLTQYGKQSCLHAWVHAANLIEKYCPSLSLAERAQFTVTAPVNAPFS